jgi:hypothetical protein
MISVLIRLHSDSVVIDNENEIEVKYQCPLGAPSTATASAATIEWTVLPGFPIKFSQRPQPSVDARTDQALQALIDEAKHRKEKDAEPLRKVRMDGAVFCIVPILV